ncbi:MAG: permease-like cell division protein FtsX [Patescibacteria group bacterium]
MFFLTVYRLVKLGVVNFWRNLWLSLVATFVLSLTLMTITFLLISAFVINGEITNIKNKIDYEVYLQDNSSEQDLESLKAAINNLVLVTEIQDISKEMAVERYKEIFGDKENLISYIEQENPLKQSIIIKTADPEDLEKIDQLVNLPKYKDLVYSSSYSRNKEIITRLIGIIDFIQKSGIAVGIIFVIIAVSVVFSIVRIAIYSRKDEIEIMKLVGATDWFVHGPFLIESSLYGILASILALGFVMAVFYYVSLAASSYLGVAEGTFLSYINEYLVFVILFQLLLGITISVSSAFVAIRKHV